MLSLATTDLSSSPPLPVSINELLERFSIDRRIAVESGSTALNDAPNALGVALNMNESWPKKPLKQWIERYEKNSSTAPKIDSDLITREALFLLDAAKDSDLGDDYETRFYDQLQIFVARYQKQAIEALTETIVSQQGNPFGVSKAIEAIGAINDPGTVAERFWLLQRGMCSASTVVRYGAALGFGSLRDSRAIRLLEQAAESESNSEVQTVLLRVIAFLKTSH